MSTSLRPLPGSSNNFTTRGPTRSEVRVKPSSNVELGVHAPASLVRVTSEFERFDYVGSQAS